MGWRGIILGAALLGLGAVVGAYALIIYLALDRPYSQESQANVGKVQATDNAYADSASPLVPQAKPTDSQGSANGKRQGEEIDKALARYTHQLAIYTALLMAATVGLGGIALWQGLQLRNTVDLARKEFITTHRPRIKVRSVQFTGPRDLSRHDANIWIANVGEGTAKEIGLESFGARKQRGGWIDGNKPILGTAITPHVCNDLAPGAPVTFGGSFPPPMDNEARDCVRSGMEILYFMGLIRYSDDNGIVRHTGFCWQYDHRTGDFVMPDKEDEYNYED
jgi:hypothetical protein